MNKEAKKVFLNALIGGHISKVEAKYLINTNGKLILNLSNNDLGKRNFEMINEILDKFPQLKKHFLNIIDLGKGERP